MYAWTHPAMTLCGEPSPALIGRAHEFADRVALIWPAPHAPFLEAGLSRQHLILLCLSVGPGDADLRTVPGASIKHALRAVLPNAPRGLPRALGRLGDGLWTAADYRLLLAMLLRPEAAKAIAHAERIRPASVRALNRLPGALAGLAFVHPETTPEHGSLLGETLAAIENRDGVAAGRRAVERWERASSLSEIFDRAREDLERDLPEPPFPGGPRLRPLATRAAITEAALRFENCLRDYIHDAANGECAFYEWTGSPGAVVQISRDDVFGWRLDEGRLRFNEAVPEPARSQLIADLRAMGVYVGRSRWELHGALQNALRGDFALPPPHEVLRWRLG